MEENLTEEERQFVKDAREQYASLCNMIVPQEGLNAIKAAFKACFGEILKGNEEWTEEKISELIDSVVDKTEFFIMPEEIDEFNAKNDKNIKLNVEGVEYPKNQPLSKMDLIAEYMPGTEKESEEGKRRMQNRAFYGRKYYDDILKTRGSGGECCMSSGGVPHISIKVDETVAISRIVHELMHAIAYHLYRDVDTKYMSGFNTVPRKDRSEQYAKYQVINEIINEFFARKVLSYLKAEDLELFGISESYHNSYFYMVPLLSDYLKAEQAQLLGALISDNPMSYVSEFGVEKFDKLAKAAEDVYGYVASASKRSGKLYLPAEDVYTMHKKAGGLDVSAYQAELRSGTVLPRALEGFSIFRPNNYGSQFDVLQGINMESKVDSGVTI